MQFSFLGLSPLWLLTLVVLIGDNWIGKLTGKLIISNTSPWISQRTAMDRRAAWLRRTKKFRLCGRICSYPVIFFLVFVIAVGVLIALGMDSDIGLLGSLLMLIFSIGYVAGLFGYGLCVIGSKASDYCAKYYDAKAIDLGRMTDELLAFGANGWGFRPAPAPGSGPTTWGKLPRPGPVQASVGPDLQGSQRHSGLGGAPEEPGARAPVRSPWSRPADHGHAT